MKTPITTSISGFETTVLIDVAEFVHKKRRPKWAASNFQLITLVSRFYFGLIQRQWVEPQVNVVSAIVLHVKEYINEICDIENPLIRVLTAVESLI